MNFASTFEMVTQDVTNDMNYDPKKQLTDIVVEKKDSSSTCSKKSSTTTRVIGSDGDTDTQQDN